MSFKKKWEQFQCLHFWVQGLHEDARYGKGFLYRWDCKRCEKSILRWSGNDPISGSDDPLYDKKDPRYNLSPPIIRRRD